MSPPPKSPPPKPPESNPPESKPPAVEPTRVEAPASPARRRSHRPPADTSPEPSVATRAVRAIGRVRAAGAVRAAVSAVSAVGRTAGVAGLGRLGRGVVAVEQRVGDRRPDDDTGDGAHHRAHDRAAHPDRRPSGHPATEPAAAEGLLEVARLPQLGPGRGPRHRLRVGGGCRLPPPAARTTARPAPARVAPVSAGRRPRRAPAPATRVARCAGGSGSARWRARRRSRVGWAGAGRAAHGAGRVDGAGPAYPPWVWSGSRPSRRSRKPMALSVGRWAPGRPRSLHPATRAARAQSGGQRAVLSLRRQNGHGHGRGRLGGADRAVRTRPVERPTPSRWSSAETSASMRGTNRSSSCCHILIRPFRSRTDRSWSRSATLAVLLTRSMNDARTRGAGGAPQQAVSFVGQRALAERLIGQP